MVESCCCVDVLSAPPRHLLLFGCFATADKSVTWGIFRRPFRLAGARILRRNCGKTAEYLAIVDVFLVRVSCDVGGLEICFLWIPKVTFGSFSGLCFASLWHESCCCVRLSQAVFQGQISRWFRSESRRAFTWLYSIFLMVFLAIVFFSMVFLLVYTCFLRCRRARDLFFMEFSPYGPMSCSGTPPCQVSLWQRAVNRNNSFGPRCDSSYSQRLRSGNFQSGYRSGNKCSVVLDVHLCHVREKWGITCFPTFLHYGGHLIAARVGHPLLHLFSCQLLRITKSFLGTHYKACRSVEHLENSILQHTPLIRLKILQITHLCHLNSTKWSWILGSLMTLSTEVARNGSSQDPMSLEHLLPVLPHLHGFWATCGWSSEVSWIWNGVLLISCLKNLKTILYVSPNSISNPAFAKHLGHPKLCGPWNSICGVAPLEGVCRDATWLWYNSLCVFCGMESVFAFLRFHTSKHDIWTPWSQVTAVRGNICELGVLSSRLWPYQTFTQKIALSLS